MATGPEHYREAERLLADADPPHEDSHWDRALLDAAQVHATLALAAATALNIQTPGPTVTECDAWQEVAGTEPAAVSP